MKDARREIERLDSSNLMEIHILCKKQVEVSDIESIDIHFNRKTDNNMTSIAKPVQEISSSNIEETNVAKSQVEISINTRSI